ncbi:MAG: choice-of-anchor D domain-containing protein, partial [Propionicimonas sp.]
MTTVDFGSVRPASGASQTIQVTNTGTESLSLNAQLDDPAGAFVVSGVPGTLAPGESVTVTVTLRPGRAGGRTATLSLGAGVAPISLVAQLTRWGVDGSTATASLDIDEFFDHLLLLADGPAWLVNRADERDADQAPDVGTLIVAGGSLADRIEIAGAAGLRAVRLSGGGGLDSLLGPAEDATWRITGDGAGTVVGVSFDGFEDLVGSADNQDTFDFADTGRIAGVVDGGAGGFDTLKVDAAGRNVVSTPYTPHSGQLFLDDSAVTYAGLEPITVTAADDVLIEGTSGADVITLVPGSTLPLTSFTVANNNAETQTFTLPTGTVTIDAKEGTDTVTLTGLAFSLSGPVRIEAETITLAAGASITSQVEVILTAFATNEPGAPTNALTAEVQVWGTINAPRVVLQATVDQNGSVATATGATVQYLLPSVARVQTHAGALIVAASLEVFAETIVDLTYALTTTATRPVSTVAAAVDVTVANSTQALLAGSVHGPTVAGVQAPLDSVLVSAHDTTNVRATITDAGTTAGRLQDLLPGTSAHFDFGNLQARLHLSRDTAATIEPSDPVVAGTVQVWARNSGSAVAQVSSDLVGIAQITADGDDARATVRGATLTVDRLAV